MTAETQETAQSVHRRPPLWRRTPADVADWFDPAAVERSRAYKKPIKKVSLVHTVADALFMAVLVFSEAVPKLLREWHITSWPLQVLVGVAAVLLGSAILGLPSSAWFNLSYDKKWELSTQTPRTWVLDQVKELAVGIVLLSAVFIPLYAVIRHTDNWWLLATGLMMLLAVVVLFVYPVLVMPIFNTFVPLGDEDLKHRIDAVAAKAGVTIKGSFTMDASRRSRRDNAFVAGFGPTKRVVVYDTMLEHPAVTVEQVVAHEIGHYRLQHVMTSLPAAMLSTLITFGLLQLLLTWDSLLDLAGVGSLRDPGSVPLFIAAFGLLQLVTGLPIAVLSRHHEREADLESLRLLRDPGAMIDVWRRMAPKNIADLEPSWWKRLNASHPDAAERMEFAKEWARLNGVAIVEPPADAPPVKPRDAEPATT